MTILISLQDPIVKDYFKPSDKQKLLSGPAGVLWKDDVLGGDGNLDAQEFKRFCDKYKPADNCKSFLKRTRAFPIQKRKIEIIEWMFKALNSPSVELYRQFAQIQAQAKKTTSSFDWDLFQKEALPLVENNGFGLGSPDHEKVASLLRPYLAKTNPPSPEILAHTFALGIQLVILEKKLNGIGNFKGKNKIKKAVTDALDQMRKGKIVMQLDPSLPKGVGGKYSTSSNSIKLEKKADELFKFEQSNKRLHEIFHFLQDLHCASENQLKIEYDAYHFAGITTQMLFPSHTTVTGVNYTPDFLVLFHDATHAELHESLETLARNILSQAGLPISVPKKKSAQELIDIEKTAKESVNTLYAIHRFWDERKTLQEEELTPKAKREALAKLPSMDVITSKFASQKGIREKISAEGRLFPLNSYLHYFYRRLVLEYELAPDSEKRDKYLLSTVLPLFKKVVPTAMVALLSNGVDKACPSQKINVIIDDPQSFQAKIASSKPPEKPKKSAKKRKTIKQKKPERPQPKPAQQTPPQDSKQHHLPSVLFKAGYQYLSLPYDQDRIYSHGVAIGFGLGYLFENFPEGIILGANTNCDFHFSFDTSSSREKQPIGQFSADAFHIGTAFLVGYNFGRKIGLFVEPEVGFHRSHIEHFQEDGFGNRIQEFGQQTRDSFWMGANAGLLSIGAIRTQAEFRTTIPDGGIIAGAGLKLDFPPMWGRE